MHVKVLRPFPHMILPDKHPYTKRSQLKIGTSSQNRREQLHQRRKQIDLNTSPSPTCALIPSLAITYELPQKSYREKQIVPESQVIGKGDKNAYYLLQCYHQYTIYLLHNSMATSSLRISSFEGLHIFRHITILFSSIRSLSTGFVNCKRNLIAMETSRFRFNSTQPYPQLLGQHIYFLVPKTSLMSSLFTFPKVTLHVDHVVFLTSQAVNSQMHRKKLSPNDIFIRLWFYLLNLCSFPFSS